MGKIFSAPLYQLWQYLVLFDVSTDKFFLQKNVPRKKTKESERDNLQDGKRGMEYSNEQYHSVISTIIGWNVLFQAETRFRLQGGGGEPERHLFSTSPKLFCMYLSSVSADSPRLVYYSRKPSLYEPYLPTHLRLVDLLAYQVQPDEKERYSLK